MCLREQNIAADQQQRASRCGAHRGHQQRATRWGDIDTALRAGGNARIGCAWIARVSIWCRREPIELQGGSDCGAPFIDGSVRWLPVIWTTAPTTAGRSPWCSG